jgi:hypothetical protein
MTPDQLLGLQSHARAKTLSPEITIEESNAVPTVIASGTQESVPIYVEAMVEVAPAEPLDEVVAELQAKFAPPAPRVRTVVSRANDLGAFVGFALFGAWTLVEVAMLLAR